MYVQFKIFIVRKNTTIVYLKQNVALIVDTYYTNYEYNDQL